MSATSKIVLAVSLLFAGAWFSHVHARDASASDTAIKADTKEKQMSFEVGRVRGQAGQTVSVPVRVSKAPRLVTKDGRVESFDAVAFRIRVLPMDAVAGVQIRRGIERDGLEPQFESDLKSPDGVGYLAVFDASPDDIDLAARFHRRVIAYLDVTLAGGVSSGTRIELRLDPAATVISNAAGTTFFSAGNGELRLRDGRVTVIP